MQKSTVKAFARHPLCLLFRPNTAQTKFSQNPFLHWFIFVITLSAFYCRFYSHYHKDLYEKLQH